MTYLRMPVCFPLSDRRPKRSEVERRCFCSTALWAVNNAATGALAGATGFAAVPAAQSVRFAQGDSLVPTGLGMTESARFVISTEESEANEAEKSHNHNKVEIPRLRSE